MNLSNYINGTCQPIGTILTESVRQRDIEKAMKLINSYLLKRKIYTIKNIRDIVVEGKRRVGVFVWAENNMGAVFVWALEDAANIESVMFTNDSTTAEYCWSLGEPEKFVWDIKVEAKGANIVQMCKLVESVLTGKVKMDVGSISAKIQDAQLFESFVNEESTSNNPVVRELLKKRDRLYMKMRHMARRGEDTSAIEVELNDTKAEIVKARAAVRANVTSTLQADPEIIDIQNQFEEEERATPEERFDDMAAYISSVIQGVRPLALICGAPGVGKTYRVMQTIKGFNLEHGRGYKLLKGKCTPTALYTALYEMRDPGQLIVYDDCDSIFKDSDAINLLKAAYDSSDDRWVTWAVSRPPVVSQEEGELMGIVPDEKGRYVLPKEFEYKGSGIIITNWRAGMIDTAVRNRALMCDLDFTTDEILGLIEELAPKIKPGIIPDAAKQKALNYLREMADKNMPMELSIRSFTLCAGLFNTDAPERTVMRRINEQMKLASDRGGKSY